MLLYNSAPNRIVQSVFPLLANIPILIVKVCIECNDRNRNENGKRLVTLNALIHLLQAIIRLQTPGNAQNANMLILEQEVAVVFKTDIIYFQLTAYSYY